MSKWTPKQIKDLGESFEEMAAQTAGLSAPKPETLGDCIDSEIRKVVLYPDAVLRAPTVEVTEFDDNLRKLVGDLATTLYASSGIGLSAPQIGISKQVFVVDILNSSPQSKAQRPDLPPSQLLVVVNPKIWAMPKPHQVADEGCLSFPGVQARVSRPSEIVLKAYDHRGNPYSMACASLLGRVIQHEYDHLHGHLLIDSLSKKNARKLMTWVRSQQVR